jgi:hypothetical protein
VGQEGRLTVFGRFFSMARDTRKHLAFTYQTPPVVQQTDDGAKYTLSLRRQPGWQLDALNVKVTPPADMRTRSVMVDDKPVKLAADGSVSIDLNEDRTLTVLYN